MSACSATRRLLLPVEEAQLGAEQPDALDRLLDRLAGRRAVGDVGEQLDRRAVLGAARVRPRRPARPAARGRRRPGGRPPRRRARSRSCPRCRRRGAGCRWRSPVRRPCRPRRGCASWRAMIAVWLVGPPFSVTRACTTSGSSPAVSAGARSSATSTHGRGRQRHAGLRLAHEVRDDAAFDVAQVGGTFGHQAAHAGEDRDELLDGSVHGRDDRSATGERLLDRRAQPLVARQTGARGEHLGRGTVGLCGLGGEPVGHGLGRDVIGCERGVGVGEPAVPEALDGDGVDLAADSERGGVCDTRDHRRALQVRHDRIQLCASLTVNIFGRRTTQTQIKTHIRPRRRHPRRSPCTQRSASRR